MEKMGCTPVFAFVFAACAGIFFMPCFAQRAWAVVPPPDVTGQSASPLGSNQIRVTWVNPLCPTDPVDDYQRFLILRNTATIIDKPLDGSAYAFGDWIGASKVVRSANAACPPALSPYDDPGLANGQRYYYKIFTGSAAAKYSAGVQVYATPTGVITSGGTGTLLRRTNIGDNTCGGPNNACHNMRTHNSANTESQYWSTFFGWGTAETGVKYGKIVCQTCHQPHSTRNIYLIKPIISFPDNATMPSGLKWSTVDYRFREKDPLTYPDANSVMGNDEAAASGRASGTSTRICEVCHSRTKFHRYDTAGQTNLTHNNAKRCTQCHDHEQGFKPGEGGAACDVCHTRQTGPMTGVLSNSTNTYHMVMENTDITKITTPIAGIGYGQIYPAQSQPTIGSSHKRCLYCHAEMENFSPKLNKTSGPGRAYNLRVSINTAPPDQTHTALITNRDFITTRNDGGICTSCHMYAQTKDTQKRTIVDKTINTPTIDPTSFKAATHNFYVEGGGYSRGGIASEATDATTFFANCTKCHNDTLGKQYQSVSTGKQFGLHDSSLRRLNAPMNLKAFSGTVTSSGNSTVAFLSTGATWTSAQWNGRAITISSGTGSNQTRIVTTNTQSTGTNLTTFWVTGLWTATPPAGSYALLGDPIEEEVCFRCHSTSTTSNPNQASLSDFYGAKSFSNTRAMRMEQVFGTTNPYGHKILSYSGIHRADEVLAAPVNATSSGWFTDTRTGPKHVGCSDCHNPHAARKPGGDAPGDIADNQKGNGQITGWTRGLYPTIIDANKGGWTTNQWRGYILRIISGSGAGQDRLIMSNSANTVEVWTSWETVVGNTNVDNNLVSTSGDPNRSYYIISPLGHPQYGNMLSNANDDIWGVTIGGPSDWPARPTINGTLEYMPTKYAGTFFTKAQKLTGNSDKIYNLCFKCHSAYGWGTSGTPFTIPDHPTGGTCCTTYGEGPSANIAARFNPNNLAHHAVYSKGRNQPIVANYNSTSTSSYNPNWPYWKTTGSPTISINTAGVATLATSMWDTNTGKPLPVLPGWFVWIGTASDVPNNNTNRNVAGGANWGWFEITSITSLTQFQVTPAVSVMSSSFAITAGFGNTMVPPYGPWSVISCADCHDTDSSTDPSGPHASARRWIIRKFETQDFPWYNGTSVIRVRYVPPRVKTWASASSEGDNTLCVNCHRADIYGIQGNDLRAAAGPTQDGRNFIGWVTAAPGRTQFSRQQHFISDETRISSQPDSQPYGMNCMLCHGGAGRTGTTATIDIGAIHGTSLGRSYSSADAAIASNASFRGKRFITGSDWTGIQRGKVGTNGICYTTATASSFTACANGDSATLTEAVNYDYEGGTDY